MLIYLHIQIVKEETGQTKILFFYLNCVVEMSDLSVFDSSKL